MRVAHLGRSTRHALSGRGDQSTRIALLSDFFDAFRCRTRPQLAPVCPAERARERERESERETKMERGERVRGSDSGGRVGDVQSPLPFALLLTEDTTLWFRAEERFDRGAHL